jgi:rubredoxin-NAD+ reductase
MKKWECIVCGWIYDEAKGWPEDGIAPGTRWEDVPEDWLCPDCGVGKLDFEMIEMADDASEPDESETAAPSPEPVIEAVPSAAPSGAQQATMNVGTSVDDRDGKAPVVIIGTGLAGYNLAREFRKLDKTTPLLLISSDDGCSYSKPMLSTGFTKDNTADDLVMADAGKMAKQLQASIWTFTEVTAIDTQAQTISVGASIAVHYKSLVLAWGADVISPPMSGTGLDKVVSINDLLDYDDFRTRLKKTDAKKVFIIGAGLIGSEFANDLLNGGFTVEAVDPLAYNLASLLPPQAGYAVQKALEKAGAHFNFGTVAESIDSQGDGVRITLANGDQTEADIVVSAVGVRPRIQLAEASGIQVNRGIVANRLLATSAPNVYSLGDCAEVEGHVLYYVAPLMAAARALAKTLSGTPTEVVYPAMPVAIKTPACPVVVSPPPHGAEGQWEISGDGHDIVALFKDAANNLLGFALTGNGTNEKQALQKLLPAILP